MRAVIAVLVIVLLSSALALAQDASGWPSALLNADDVGSDFQATRQETLTEPGVSTYLIQFERPAELAPGSPSVVGSLLINIDGEVQPASFDSFASALVRQRTGLQPTDGPPVGDSTRWFAGSWSEDASDEAQVIVFRLGNAILSVAVAGPTGSVTQDAVLSYSAIITDRVTRLRATPTPTIAATGTPIERTSTPVRSTLPPTSTAAPVTSTPTFLPLPFPPPAPPFRR